jgi:hypothetical protein
VDAAPLSNHPFWAHGIVQRSGAQYPNDQTSVNSLGSRAINVPRYLEIRLLQWLIRPRWRCAQIFRMTMMTSKTSTVLHRVHDPEDKALLRLRSKCPHFRVLIMGKANSGKTTILEKMCGAAAGTPPHVYDGGEEAIRCSRTPNLTSSI